MIRVLMVDDEPLVRRGIVAASIGRRWAARSSARRRAGKKGLRWRGSSNRN